MNDAQTWTLIGGFFALVATTGSLMLRVMQAEFRAVHVKIDGLDGRLTTRIDDVERRLGDKIDHLESDVSLVFKRLYGDG